MTSPTQRWEKILDLMSVPGYPGLYVLGSFAKRVTLYSQQVRALNLVEALCKTQRLAPGAAVAVIGGGASGMTAAAAAAVRGLGVHLMEQFSLLLRLQRNSHQRYLHPHIYDWPDEDSLSVDAGLPLLNWQAGFAHAVAAQIESQWAEIKSREGVKIQEHWKATDFRISPASGGRINLNWNDKVGPHNLTFAAVVIAVGFGLEADADWQRSYWEDDGLDFIANRSWLVSGYGDGGLTDLMRLRINDLRHDEIVKLFANAPDLDEKRELLLRIETESQEVARHPDPARSVREFITERYQEIESAPVMEILRERLRDDVKVTFNGASPYIYGPESSILNRFVVSQLARLGAFRHRPGRLGTPARHADQKFRVTFDDGREEVFDRVILRHGPTTAALEKDFPEVWKACEGQRGRWRDMPPALDPTRKAMWEPGAFEPGEAGCFGAAARPDADLDYGVGVEGGLACVVVTPESGASDQLFGFIRHALARQKAALERVTGRALRDEPITIDAGRALTNPTEYDRAVRALCKADIVVFDLTGYEPGMMLLLGIRSVVRRGVTITTISERLDGNEWSKLPFNLKELNPISYKSEGLTHEHPRHPIKVLGSMIEKGLSLSYSLPQFYLDLPAFDAVRRLGPNPEHYRAVPPEKQILILCSFEDEYVRHNWEGFLSLELATTFSEHGPTLARIIDIISPRLVSHRLYAEIRRSSMCLVDWTGWRANVFYELGVRLCVNSIGPVNIICRDSLPQPGAPHAQREALVRLFSPIAYDLADRSGAFGGELRRRYDDISQTPEAGANSWGGLAHDHTFKLVYNSILLEQEPGGNPVHRELRDAVKAMLGEDPRMQGTKPVLFSQNPALMKQVRAGAVERLLAAWYYLQQRHAADRLPADDPRRLDYISIGNMLSSMLLESNDPEEQRLGEQIDNEIFALESGAGEEATQV